MGIQSRGTPTFLCIIFNHYMGAPQLLSTVYMTGPIVLDFTWLNTSSSRPLVPGCPVCTQGRRLAPGLLQTAQPTERHDHHHPLVRPRLPCFSELSPSGPGDSTRKLGQCFGH